MAGGMLWVAEPCGCVHEQFQGIKRPKVCACGNLFEKPAVVKARKERAEQRATAGRKKASSTRRQPIKRSEPKRDWSDARAKVEGEACCRICKKPAAFGRPLEAAHVLGREHDERKIGADGWPIQERYVHPDRIFPACGPSPDGCHGDVDARRINYLQVLTLAEQIKAVEDAGGIEAARIRLAPVEHREEVERSAA